MQDNKTRRSGMKKLLVVLMAVMLSAPAFAFPMIQEGAREMDLDFDYRDGDWELGIGYGVFVTDNMLVGGRLDYVDWADTWQLGGMAEYHWVRGEMTVPYAGVVVAYMDYDVDSIMFYGPKAGIKHFITDYLAIDLNAQYLFSDEEGYEEEIEVKAGMRVLF
jgi:hypothetical protein